jgi:hypothetical protein
MGHVNIATFFTLARLLYHSVFLDEWVRKTRKPLVLLRTAELKDNASRDNICVRLDESKLA